MPIFAAPAWVNTAIDFLPVVRPIPLQQLPQMIFTINANFFKNKEITKPNKIKQTIYHCYHYKAEIPIKTLLKYIFAIIRSNSVYTNFLIVFHVKTQISISKIAKKNTSKFLRLKKMKKKYFI